MSKQTPPQAATSRAARNLMTAKGMSQADLAHALGLTVKTVSNRLNGYRRWTLDDVDALALLGAEVPRISEAVSVR